MSRTVFFYGLFRYTAGFLIILLLLLIVFKKHFIFEEDEQQSPLIQFVIPYKVEDGNHQDRKMIYFPPNLDQVSDRNVVYELNAFGYDFILDLELDSKFNIPKTVSDVFQNGTQHWHPVNVKNFCYYIGSVRGDKSSFVIVSLCNHMVGFIQLSNESYRIEPVKKRNIDHLHVIERIGTENWNNFRFWQNLNESVTINKSERSRYRSKRDVTFHYNTEYVVEILLVADRTLFEFYKEDFNLLMTYVCALMRHSELLFRHETVGHSISIVLENVSIFHDNLSYDQGNGVNATDILKQFCEWKYRTYDVKNQIYDAAIFLTKNDICNEESGTKCAILGLAQLGKMCTEKENCAIVKDTGLTTAYTITHELGHLLNIIHDDHKICMDSNNSTSPDSLFVMNPMYETSAKFWFWSNCSRSFLSDFLQSQNSWCLTNSAKNDLVKHVIQTSFPGEVFNLSYQCEIAHGVGYEACPYQDSCNSLKCQERGNAKRNRCYDYSMPLPDGTKCGRGKWCYQGDCIIADRASLQPINGGWSTWSDYSKCSRQCGGGIQESRRQCDSPMPKHGGFFCKGHNIRYKSCNTAQCPDNMPEFREMQCAEFNGNTMNIKELNSSVKWVPKYGFNGDDLCKLYCQIAGTRKYHLLKERVIDGTKCSLDTYDVCIRGVCRSAGCDNVLKSDAKLDECGRCKGNNEGCSLITKTFNGTFNGFKKLFEIKKGSTNIDIVQTSNKLPRYDKVYLVLMDSETNQYLLNSNNMVSRYMKQFTYGGLTFEYNGAHSVYERVYTVTRNRNLTKDLIVALLVAEGEPVNVTITFQRQLFEWSVGKQYCREVRERGFSDDIYCLNRQENTVADEDRCSKLERLQLSHDCLREFNYKWIYDNWSLCNCNNGTQARRLTCIDSITKTIAPIEKCDPVSRPNIQVRVCSCFDWLVSEWSECNTTCGSGYRKRVVYCISKTDGNNRVDVVKCKKIGEKPHDTQSCLGTECNDIYDNNIYHVDVDSKNMFRWRTGNWSKCSKSCGHGWKKRLVICQNAFGENVDDSLCYEKPKPKDTDNCKQRDCPLWKTEEWSKCNAQCVKHRVVLCKRGSNEIVPDNECDLKLKPISKKDCFFCNEANRTVRFMWKFTSWSNCSQSCGIGFQSRYVYCSFIRNNYMVQDEICEAFKRPRKKRKCFVRPCRIPKSINRINDSLHRWELGPWSNCFIARNSKWIQKRKVDCHHTKSRRKVNFKLCENRIGKPKLRRHCFRNCKEIQMQKNIHRNGYYFLYLNPEQKIKIFCAAMETDTPLEYVDLTNNTENYSEFFDLRLMTNHSICTENINCIADGACKKIPEDRFGKTVFSKIRLNVTSLRVITDDFEYSKQIFGKERLPFGTAGDCYSSSKRCPMGKFKIDLTGTGLRVSNSVNWIGMGSFNVVQVQRIDSNNEILSGRCGGYCGKCYPNIEFGLQLELS